MKSEKIKFLEAARKYIGVKWVHQGRSSAGMDCLGLIVMAARDIGYKAKEDFTTYGRRPDTNYMLSVLDGYFDRVDAEKASPGDILVFRIPPSLSPQHLGIKSDIGILHSTFTERKCVEHSLDKAWMRRIHAAFDFNPRVIKDG